MSLCLNEIVLTHITLALSMNLLQCVLCIELDLSATDILVTKIQWKL